MSVPGPNAYSRAEREKIVNTWTYDQVVAEAEKTVGRAVCDRSIFLRRVAAYKGKSIGLEIRLKEGYYDRDIPFGTGKYTRSGMLDYERQKRMLETERRHLIQFGRYRMGVMA